MPMQPKIWRLSQACSLPHERGVSEGYGNMKRVLVAFAAIAMMGISPVGFAAEAEEEPKDQQFDFDGDEVTTDYLKPNALLVEGLRRGRRSSLIQVRLDFVAEILKSAEDI